MCRSWSRAAALRSTAIPAIPDEVYRALGFKVVGKRAVRLDILERVGDVIRGYMSWRPLAETPKPDGRGRWHVLHRHTRVDIPLGFEL
jgi:hypothetical protein